jgi:hypothetical protein
MLTDMHSNNKAFNGHQFFVGGGHVSDQVVEQLKAHKSVVAWDDIGEEGKGWWVA